MSKYERAMEILQHRFGKDMLISVATVSGGKPHVRTVDAYYENGAFYVVTYTLSTKMHHIAANNDVAVCGEWFTAHGVGENLGWIRDESNDEIAGKLRHAFAAWLGNGHVNEDDKNTCILRIRLEDGVLNNEGVRYEIDFAAAEAN